MAAGGRDGGDDVATASEGSDGVALPRVVPLAKYKLVFLGDQGVGKTSLIKHFMFGTFDPRYQVRAEACTRDTPPPAPARSPRVRPALRTFPRHSPARADHHRH
jgi:GTPase SAR1 family protein